MFFNVAPADCIYLATSEISRKKLDRCTRIRQRSIVNHFANVGGVDVRWGISAVDKIAGAQIVEQTDEYVKKMSAIDVALVANQEYFSTLNKI